MVPIKNEEAGAIEPHLLIGQTHRLLLYLGGHVAHHRCLVMGVGPIKDGAAEAHHRLVTQVAVDSHRNRFDLLAHCLSSLRMPDWHLPSRYTI